MAVPYVTLDAGYQTPQTESSYLSPFGHSGRWSNFSRLLTLIFQVSQQEGLGHDCLHLTWTFMKVLYVLTSIDSSIHFLQPINHILNSSLSPHKFGLLWPGKDHLNGWNSAASLGGFVQYAILNICDHFYAFIHNWTIVMDCRIYQAH